jgi:hypothetical protein
VDVARCDTLPVEETIDGAAEADQVRRGFPETLPGDELTVTREGNAADHV